MQDDTTGLKELIQVSISRSIAALHNIAQCGKHGIHVDDAFFMVITSNIELISLIIGGPKYKEMVEDITYGRLFRKHKTNSEAISKTQELVDDLFEIYKDKTNINQYYTKWNLQ